MPRHLSTSQSSQRSAPYARPTTTATTTTTMSAQVMHYGPSQHSHHTQHTQHWTDPLRHPQPHHQAPLPQFQALPITLAPATHPLPSHSRSDSQSQSHLARAGIWSEADDATLRTARAQSHGWSYIANNYFPGKTGNACRKRHERLVKKSGGGNDAARLDLIAREYMGSREGIWKGLAERTGENWKDVERLCMEQGLNNLKTIGRRVGRGGGCQTGQTSPNDDSGLGASNMSDGDSGFAGGRSRRTSGAMGFDQLLTSPERR